MLQYKFSFNRYANKSYIFIPYDFSINLIFDNSVFGDNRFLQWVELVKFLIDKFYFYCSDFK